MDSDGEGGEAAMMAMMGLSGFGTTKVSVLQSHGTHLVNILVILEQAGRGQSRRRCAHQEAASMAPVHESASGWICLF